MRTRLSIILMLLLIKQDPMFSQGNNKSDRALNTRIDSVTKKLIYDTVDVLPVNEGGKGALMKRLESGISTNISPKADYDPNVIVAFIVDTDGSIVGERVVKDDTNSVGKTALSIVKTFKWKPAKCGNRNVAMLYTLPIIVDISEQ